MTAAGVDAAFALARSGFALDVAFQAPSGAVTALFGPSGCGKTTTLRCIAGQDRPDSGRIAIGGIDVFDAGRRIRLPAERRQVAGVFRDGGEQSRKTVRDMLRHHAIDGAADAFGVEGLLARRCHELSASERLRVSLARAIRPGVRLLLLDEPLAALDPASRPEMLEVIRALRRRLGVTVLHAGNDARDAAWIADRMVLMDQGRVLAAGPVSALTQDERHHALLADAGTVIDAQVCGKDLVHEMIELRLAGSVIRVPAFHTAIGRTVRVHLDPRDVAIAIRPPAQRGLGILPGTVRAMLPHGPLEIDVAITCGPTIIWSRVSCILARQLALGAGVPVFAVIDAVALDRADR